MSSDSATPLVADHVVEFPGGYTRSLGPVVGRFLTGLRDGVIIGVRMPDGRVQVPPAEYAPDGTSLGSADDDFVWVEPAGTVLTWAWVSRPRDRHPLNRPFAWALIRLDGADTALLHIVDGGEPERMASGMRVRARWSDEPVGHILDIACFEPEEAA